MKTEYLAVSRFGFAVIGTEGYDVSAFIHKRQGLAVIYQLEFGDRVFGGLFFNAGELVAVLLGFGFDHSNRFATDEQDVIGGAGVGLVFSDGLIYAPMQVDPIFILDNPTRLQQQLVDLVAG